MKKQLIHLLVSTLFGFVGAFIFDLSSFNKTGEIKGIDDIIENVVLTKNNSNENYFENKPSLNNRKEITTITDFKFASAKSMESVVYIKTVGGVSTKGIVGSIYFLTEEPTKEK